MERSNLIRDSDASISLLTASYWESCSLRVSEQIAATPSRLGQLTCSDAHRRPFPQPATRRAEPRREEPHGRETMRRSPVWGKTHCISCLCSSCRSPRLTSRLMVSPSILHAALLGIVMSLWVRLCVSGIPTRPPYILPFVTKRHPQVWCSRLHGRFESRRVSLALSPMVADFLLLV